MMLYLASQDMIDGRGFQVTFVRDFGSLGPDAQMVDQEWNIRFARNLAFQAAGQGRCIAGTFRMSTEHEAGVPVN